MSLQNLVTMGVQVNVTIGENQAQNIVQALLKMPLFTLTVILTIKQESSIEQMFQR